eukprot:scaffold978_cov230-Chaetoceros_neogracile.AAC.8
MGEDRKKDAPRASSVGKFCYYRRVELSRNFGLAPCYYCTFTSCRLLVGRRGGVQPIGPTGSNPKLTQEQFCPPAST